MAHAGCATRPPMNLEELYTPRILALATQIPHLGRLENPDASASLHSRLCGSRITVDIGLDDGRIARFAQDVQACALAQASAAIMGQQVLGRSAKDMRAARAALRAMLKEAAAPPAGRWSGLAELEPVRHVPIRHDSVLLPFDAMLAALEKAGV